MNDLKTKLIAKMQEELDRLKSTIINGDKGTVLEKAYEYIFKREIIYAAHKSELTDRQTTALLSSASPLNDIYASYLKLDETALSDVITDCMIREADRKVLNYNEQSAVNDEDENMEL